MQQIFYIISAEKPENTGFRNQAATNLLRSVLESNGYAYSEVLGKFQGVLERGFLITGADEKKALMIARTFNQHSILRRNADGSADLLDANQQKPDWYLGRWVEATYTEAEQAPAYTFDPNTGRYYITVGGQRSDNTESTNVTIGGQRE